MLKFRRNSKPVPKYLKQNKAPSGKRTASGKPVPRGKVNPADLSAVQKNITRQAMLAGLTVVLTIVILFAMTSAWYTNIVQTSNLMFEAESWGFDGEITVNNEAITAAPGDEGLVHLEVENASDSISAISVNISKVGMLEAMQQRLFFYVDTHMNRDGETMDRVYLNNREGYTYTIFSKGNLTLTEKVSNAPQLKWHWVYDVLGYYVVAQHSTVKDENGVEVPRTTIEEYLRPIEYDFDEATTVLDESDPANLTMRLATVDGTRSPEVFLQQLSLNDGYAGQINPNERTEDGYYPVDVDPKTGYGVYAYLCNYGEIERATEYDTKLGQLVYDQKVNGKKPEGDDALLLQQQIVTLTISAQKNETKAVNVPSLGSLQDAITKYKADVIQLSENIAIPAGQSLTIPEDTRVMLDLNGKTITCYSDKAINGLPGSSLTMINGTIQGPDDGSKTYGVSTTGAEVVMSDVAVTGFQYGVFMGDYVENNPLDSRVHMVDCTVDAEYYAVFINGNGLQSEQKTQLIVEKCTLTSDGIVLTSNGNAERAGTDIQIIESELEQTSDLQGAAIYHPQKDSTLRLYKSKVSGYTAVAIKAGSVDIVASTITGTGIQTIPPAFSGSGFTDTADAVYIETNYGHEICLTISENSKLTCSNQGNPESQSLRVYKEDATNVLVKIYSGIFDEAQPEAYIAEGSEQNGTTVTVK